jgi:ACS family glucarate transporter-like MFS transporter
MSTTRSPLRVRWVIFAFLFAYAFVAYVQRTSISVAAERMMPALGFGQVEIGWLLSAFMVGYAVFQVPGGLLGEWLGARSALAAVGLLACIATAATPLAPALFGGTPLFVALVVTRMTVGAAQAPVVPVSAGVIESWFPVRQWAFAQGLQAVGILLGAAATPPIVAWLMQGAGWRAALLWTSLPGLVLVALWAWYGRNTPEEHRGVSDEELAETRADRIPRTTGRVTMRDVARVLGDRNILLISVSYLLMSVVYYLLTYWCFLYLVEERHFTILEGAWLSTLPFLAAAVAALAGGRVTDLLCVRLGPRRGFRLVPLVALPLAGVLLFVAVSAASAYWAVAWLSITFATLELTEGGFMAAAMSVARNHSMAAVGVINTASTIGGLVATPVVAALTATHGWTSAFVLGSVCAVLSGVLWLVIDAGRPLVPDVAGPGPGATGPVD